MPTFFLAPTADFVQTTLNGAITNSATTITLNSITNVTAPGYAVIDRQNSAGTATPSAREIITYTGISGNNLTGVTRGVDGSTALAHNDGAIVEFTPTQGMWNNLVTIVSTAFTSDSYLKALVSPVTLSIMKIPTQLDVSGASVTGIGTGLFPTWFVAGFASAATTNAMRLIMPRAGTFQFFTMTTRTPVSAASLNVALYRIGSGTSIFDTIGRPAILGGGTFVSTASIKTPNFSPGDVLRLDIETGGNVSDVLLVGAAY